MEFVLGLVVGGMVALVIMSAFFLFDKDDSVENFRYSLSQAVGSLTEDEDGKVSKRIVMMIIRDLGGM